jgi:integrase
MMRKTETKTASFEDRNCPWRSFTRDFGLLLKKAEVAHKRFEDLRITCGLSLAQANIDMLTAQELLRHSDTCTTYGHYQQYKKKPAPTDLHEQIAIYNQPRDLSVNQRSK